jgi:hypothetical protein
MEHAKSLRMIHEFFTYEATLGDYVTLAVNYRVAIIKN